MINSINFCFKVMNVVKYIIWIKKNYIMKVIYNYTNN